jgi:hypothetical protein
MSSVDVGGSQNLMVTAEARQREGFSEHIRAIPVSRTADD